MIKTLTVPVDHGNRNIKTKNLIFTTGLNVLDRKPGRGRTIWNTKGSIILCQKKESLINGIKHRMHVFLS